MVLTPPPIVIGGDKKADAEMEQAPPWLVEGWSGRQLPGCLVGVRACVRECQCLDGDVWGLGAAELASVLTSAPSGDSSPSPPHICCSRLQARRWQED